MWLMAINGFLKGQDLSQEQVKELLQVMQDPAGAPFYPWVMQLLQVITWVLHILFVWVVVGGLGYAVLGFFSQSEFRQRLAKAMLELAKVSVSLAIVLGVAPLLFYQVIYDPLWYTSANLSAAWYMMFIVFLLVGYYLVWGGYFTQKYPKVAGVLTLLGLVCILLVGFLIHVVNYQALFPEKWIRWYTSNGTSMNIDGWNIYAFNIWRYGEFLVVPSIVGLGVFLVLYDWYFSRRAEFDSGFGRWVAQKGVFLSLSGAFLWLAFHLAHAATLPNDWGVKSHLLTWLPLVGISIVIFVSILALKQPRKLALALSASLVVAALAMGVFREWLRVASVARFGYKLAEYKLNLEWLSPLLFFGTLATGILLYGYSWLMAYRVGRTSAGQVYQPSESELALGSLAVFVVSLWAVVFVGTGLIVVVKNY